MYQLVFYGLLSILYFGNVYNNVLRIRVFDINYFQSNQFTSILINT